jgi:hypothetical protein
MNIEDLTIGQARQLAALFGNQSLPENEGISDMVGKKCVIRTQSAGVWFGKVTKKAGREVIVENARRLWYWKAAKSISLSGVAVYGVISEQCRLAPEVGLVWLEAIELIPATEKAIRSIEETPDAET